MASESKAGALASGIKDQLALVSVLVLFAGFVATDTYYAAFGLRFQVLDLSIDHLVYRGITAVITSWPLAAAYILAVGWLAYGAQLLKLARPKITSQATEAITYGVVLAVTIVAYFSAIASGRANAADDILQSSSRLPVIQSVRNAAGTELPLTGDRLLLSTKDLLVVFKAVNDANEVPFIHMLKGDDVHEMVVSR